MADMDATTPEDALTEPREGSPAPNLHQAPASRLAFMSQAESALAQARDIQDLAEFIDQAEVARTAAKELKLGTAAINHATSLKLRAEVRLAGAVDKGQANGEIASLGHNQHTPEGVRTPNTLPDLGLSAREVSEARTVRDYFEDENAVLVLEEEATANDKELARYQVLRDARRSRRKVEPRATPVLPVGVFDVVYADPPWRYEHVRDSHRGIEDKYPTMTVPELCDIDPPVADNAVLYLWATNPKLEEALQVMAAWGFTYRTNMVWVKDRIGMGYYARARHELLLIGARGTPGTPDPSVRPDSVIEAPRGEHSTKPVEVRGLLEELWPGRRYLEMFARDQVPGWEAWGHDA